MIGRNLRIVAATILIGTIIYNSKITIKNYIDSLSVVILLHVFFIYIQLIYPDIKEPMARIFNYDREFFYNSGIRCLGLCGSYDFAGLISILGILLFSLKYKYSQNILDLFFFILAFISVAFISRFAMILGFVCFIYGSIQILRKSKFIIKLAFLSLFVLSSIFWIRFSLPIIMSSLSFFGGDSTNIDILNEEGNKYSYGKSDENLLTNHMILPKNIDLIIGQGIEIGKGTKTESDIGYVKLIYSIGLIGVWLVVLIHYKMLKIAYFVNKSVSDSNFKLLLTFFIFLIILVLIMNSKLLLLYSRGIYDLILINFFLIDKYKINTNNNII